MWLLSSQRASPQNQYQKVTLVNIVNGEGAAKNYILDKSRLGYKVIQLESFSDGSSSFSDKFIIVMEK